MTNVLDKIIRSPKCWNYKGWRYILLKIKRFIYNFVSFAGYPGQTSSDPCLKFNSLSQAFFFQAFLQILLWLSKLQWSISGLFYSTVQLKRITSYSNLVFLFAVCLLPSPLSQCPAKFLVSFLLKESFSTDDKYD